ncbi:hypothetical protein MPTK1_8g16380 [Marchantia polymorpha subsp. ruderalis]|uniref:Small nuclear ribonucleoprotein Prp3 C-terminal domain-containing protein n=1 Tax=Marchantia polymorpha TaxID=3197 RepID=A0A2R6W4N6_MARPO|nr:hypothetical protein MARPO_0154s0026 [Marchantia polymorpha]BBN20093.1 hypothetical protein Mp_8g16380 [Marchantia polymorpha subsp. ruderalis]|eukprot:PTQ28800.1 hypothetical protein MARPO_0154s0026 [Marchantia polymorpha]
MNHLMIGRFCPPLQGTNTPTRLFVSWCSPGVATAEKASGGSVLGRVGVVCFSKSSRHFAVEESNESARPAKKSSSSCLGRTLIWFHHIKSSKKKRDIKEWGAELNLGGYCKPGFPGVLIFEGDAENVAEYVRRIKRLRWQHLQIRGQEVEALTEGQDLDSCRRFPLGVKELPESGMSELAERCREANLEQLYLTAFKISR